MWSIQGLASGRILWTIFIPLKKQDSRSAGKKEAFCSVIDRSEISRYILKLIRKANNYKG